MFFRTPALSLIKKELLLAEMKKISPDIVGLATEWCFYVETDRQLSGEELTILNWLLSETFEPAQFGQASLIQKEGKYFEVGPRQGLVTPWNTSAVDICRACGLTKVTRLERARRYALVLDPNVQLRDDEAKAINRLLYDRMTEQVYAEPLRAFESGYQPDLVKTIPIIERGAEALKEYAKANDFAWSDLIKYIVDYFVSQAKRNPTDVELFMFGQLNSEHCRHHKFNGKYIIDGVLQPMTLLQMIKSTYKGNEGPVAVAFSDNAAILKPILVTGFMPQNPLEPSSFGTKQMKYCFAFKVETHNHPTAISPYQGAATGVAVRRDVLGAGRGGVPTFHVAGYYVGPLRIRDYDLPWEQKVLAPHPERLATPLKIIIEASNGASDNANCFGNPVTMGFFRSFEGMVGSTHYGWTKCAMIAGSGGYLENEHVKKQEPAKGMLLVQTGGQAFRIGLGGGSGSSRDAGDSHVELDFNSVQRGDPVMEQRNHSVYRACSELGAKNPICNTTDLGAGGYCVAFGEIVFPSGARIEIRELPCGDSTMPVFVFWCNESQERMAVLIKPERLADFQKLCERNRCPCYVCGEITGDGQFVLTDKAAANELSIEQSKPIDLSMKFMLADLPQISVEDKSVKPDLKALVLPKKGLLELLHLILRLPDVGSKEFLTRKADRSVGGKIAQQQTVGPLQTTLADNMVISASFFETIGHALSIGEQPIKGLINVEAGVRMSLSEALLNLAWAKVKGLNSVNLSATWQWPCGQNGEDARLYQAVDALTRLCKVLGVRIAVGKDSVSMTAKTVKDGHTHSIRAPGTVQVMAFAPCPDITKKVTPDIKEPGKSKLMFINLSYLQRLGGSALARVLGQLGDETPDVNTTLLSHGFDAIQQLVEKNLILAGHDRSDGGLITCLLEMAFAGNCGLSLDFGGRYCLNLTNFLFNEEAGTVIEYLPENEKRVKEVLRKHHLEGRFYTIGQTIANRIIKLRHDGKSVMSVPLQDLRASWRETSFQLDALQANPEVVKAERKNTLARENPVYKLTFEPRPTLKKVLAAKSRPVAAVIREVGTNGDREMAAALFMAGFQVMDIHMTDLITGRASLKKADMMAGPGGFSFGDVFDSGKGEAGATKFNPRVADEIASFCERKGTCGIGVCNGCQYFALAGIVPKFGIESVRQPRFICNTSDIFESRLVNVQILESPSIFLQGMAGSILPVIVAHHEGYLHFPDESIMAEVIAMGLSPIRFVNDFGGITEDYPFNPNGSPQGMTSLITPDGRFLAMMPHPERTFLKWQMPYLPPKWRGLKAAPWLRLFQNAREWCAQS